MIDTETSHMDIPTDIIEAAQKVENWMKRNGHNRWELLGICSRDHAAELKCGTVDNATPCTKTPNDLNASIARSHSTTHERGGPLTPELKQDANPPFAAPLG